MSYRHLLNTFRLTAAELSAALRAAVSTVPTHESSVPIVLEQRVLMSATPIDVIAPASELDAGSDASTESAPMVASETFAPPVGNTDDTLSEGPNAASADDSAAVRELVFVDAGVDNYEFLLQEYSRSGTEIVVLDSDQDGVLQISQTLAAYQQLDAIHIVSHGSDGAVQLGNTILNLDSLVGYTGEVASWSNALTSDADILIYGCELASTSDGEAFVDALSSISGADVAASDDITGHADLGGDWELEYTIGTVETDLAFSYDVHANWFEILELTSSGGETLAHTSTPQNQLTTTNGGGNVAINSSGQYAVVWEDYRDGNSDVYAAIYNADGSVRTADFRVHVATPTNELNPVIALTDAGNVIVVGTATVGGNDAPYVFIMDLDGNAVSSPALVGAGTGTEDQASIDTADDGSFVVAFTNVTDGDVYIRRYNSSGTAQGSLTRVNSSLGSQSDAHVAVAGDGSFTVVWTNSGLDGSGDGIYGQRYSASGTALGSNFLVNQTTTGNQSNGQIDADQYGNFVVTWQSDDGNGTGVWARQFDASGTALGAEFQVNTYTTGNQQGPNVSVSGTGDFIITWSDTSGHDGTGIGVYAQHYSSSGDALGGEILVNTTTSNDQRNPTVAHQGSSAVIVWSGNGSQSGQVDANGVFIQRFDVTLPLANNVPSAQSTAEDTALVFSAAIGNAVSVQGDSGHNQTVTLSVGSGTLTLSGTSGLTFATGDGTADAIIEFTGSLANINAALEGLSFQPAANASGGVTLTMNSVYTEQEILNSDAALVGQYTFEITGSLGTDSSGSGNTGTNNFSNAVSDPDRGNVVEFDGGNDYIQITGTMGNPSNVTLAGWINTNAATFDGEFISLGDNVMIRIYDNGTSIDAFYYDGASWNAITKTNVLTAGSWHHIAYAFDDVGNTQSLYVDGVEVASGSYSNSISYSLGSNTFLGRHGNGDANFDFHGLADDIRIYSRALTASEVEVLALDSPGDSDTVSITVTAVNDEQSIDTNAGATFAENSTGNVLTTAMLETTDVESTAAQLTYTLTSSASFGTLRLSGTALGVNDTFTQANIDAGVVTYDHDGSENFADGFNFSVDDGAGTASTGTFSIALTPVNDQAVAITSNGGGSTASISVNETVSSVTQVTVSDADLPGDTFTYSIIGGPDQSRFSISSSGELTFVSAPDYETPTDQDTNNVYTVTVQVSDAVHTDTQSISVTVLDVQSTSLAVTTTADTDDTGLGASYTIEQLYAVGGGTDGHVSLREAIIAANNTSGQDTISFAILNTDAGYAGTTGVDAQWSISLTASLPTITESLILDATTQTTFGGNTNAGTLSAISTVGTTAQSISAVERPEIVIVGSSGIGGGIYIDAANVTVTGLAMYGFTDTGDLAALNLTSNATSALIDGNVFGFSGAGLADPGVALSNNRHIFSSGADNVSVTDNFMSYSLANALYVKDASDNWTIRGNQIINIGLNYSNGDGITYSGNTGGLIENNYVTGASTQAMVFGGNSTGVTISNNTITGSGVGPASGSHVQYDAVAIRSGSSNFTISQNIIADNYGAGVMVNDGASGVELTQNSFYGNGTVLSRQGAAAIGAIAIDLQTTGENANFGSAPYTTANDVGDADTGGNSLQNFPVFTSVSTNSSQVVVQGSLNSTASTTYRIEVFRTAAYASGIGQGEQYLGSFQVTTDGSGNATFSETLTAVLSSGSYITATATNLTTSETSEFSAQVLANTAPQILGATILSNGDFPSDLSSWTATGNVDQSSGQVRFGQIGGANGVLSQSFSTVAGQVYHVSFDYGDLSSTLSQSMQVEIDGAVQLVNQEITTASSQLDPYSYQFIADSTTTTLTFTDTSASHSGVRGYLDNVAVRTNTTAQTSLSFTEGDSASVIDGAILLGDVDSANLESATVEITGNYETGVDVLAFVDQNGISGTFNSANGTLTLTGSATVAQYQTALRSVTYANASESPSAASREVSIAVHDGAIESNIAVRTIAFTAINGVPVTASIEGTALAYTENASATVITSTLTLSDVDDTNLENARIQVTGNYVSGEDVLAFVNQNGITGSFNTTSGLLTLTGSATVAQYQTAIRSVTYVNTSENPSTSTRTASITVNDGDGNSNTQTRNITIAAVNDAPTLTSFSGVVDSTSEDTEVEITFAELITAGNEADVDGTVDAFVVKTIVSGTLRIGTDAASATAWAASTNDTVSASLNAYWTPVADTSGTHNAFTVVAKDNAGTESATNITAQISVSAVNDAATLNNIAGDLYEYTAGEGAVLIEQGADVVVADVDSANFTGGNLTVALTSGTDTSQDVLAVRNQGTGAGQIGLSGSNVTYAGVQIGTVTGGSSGTDLVITLNGSASTAAVAALVENITFENTNGSAPTTGAREVRFTLDDGDGTVSHGYDATINIQGSNTATVLDRFSSVSYSNNDGSVNWNGSWQELGESNGAGSGNVEVDSSRDALEIGGSSLLGLSISGDGASRSADLSTAVSATLCIDVWRYGNTSSGSITLAVSSDGSNWTNLQTFSNSNLSTSRTAFTYDITAYASATTHVRILGSGSVGSLLTTGYFYSDNIAIDYVYNTAPTVSLPGSQVNFTEDGSAVQIDATAVVSDAESPNFDGGQLTTSITAGASANDRLTIRNEGTAAGQVGISGSNVTYAGTTIGSYTGGTNGSTPLVVSFNSNATASIVQAVARNVSFSNISDTPSTATRTVQFSLTDGDGGTSTSVSENVTVTAVNDAAIVASLEGSSLAFTENGSATAITATLTLSDADDTNLESATVQITGNFATGQDVLAFTNQNGITGAFNSSTGTLTLSGSATVAQYQTALRSVTYQNTSESPSTSTRTISFTVNDGDANSNTATRNVAVTAVNDAPVLDNSGTMTLPTITEDDVNNSGQTVAQVLASATGDRITDVDGGAAEGIAITVRNNGRGTWQYSVNGGSSWLSVGTVSESSALLLRSTDLVRFAPDGENAIADRTIEFRAWDQTSGSAGTKVDVTTNGGSSAYSTATETATITTTTVNDAPVLDNSGAVSLQTQSEDSGSPVGAVGTVITDIVQIGSNVTDVDASAQTGIAITAAVASNGSWWYTTDGGTNWSALGTPSDSNARLLNSNSNTRLYFQADANFNGTVNNAITFRAWDRSSGSNGGLGDTTSNGGTTEFSAAVETANLTISAVNDAPVTASIEGAALAYTENDAATAITSTLSLSDIDDTNLESATVQITGNFATGQDVLAFVNQNGITGAFNTTNGTLTLTGTATVAQYQTALRSVTYTNTSDDPSAATRTVSYTVNDGDTNSNIAARNIAFTATNDAPITASIEGAALAYTENDAATAITSALSLSDVDDTNLESATVQITGNFATGEDVLAFVNQNGITGAFNTTNGTLTLTGTATVAQYQTALRSVTYTNTSDDPSAATRTVSYTVNDGDTNSNIAARNIAFTAVNDAPVTASIEAGALAYTENDAATALTSALSLSDIDDTNLESATVQITGNFATGEDVLAFVNQNGISGSFNATNGTLTLTGTATVAQYQAALRSVTYTNTSDDPSAATRTVSYTVNDGDTNSNIAARNIAFTAVNDAPVTASIEGAALTYTENDAATAITSALSLSDVDDTSLESATVQITGNFATGEDGLAFVNQNGISGSFNTTNGTLTLTGTATVAQYQTALRSVTYVNTSDDPSAATRTVSYTVNDGDTNSNIATRNIAFTAVNDAPVTASIEGAALAFTENDAATAITSALAISDVDDTNLESATVQITGNFATGEDVLAFVNQNGITGSFNTTNGTLTLTGTATVAQYQTALRSVTYVNTSDDPSAATRTVSYTVNDGDTNSNIATRNIAFTATNDAPVTASIEGAALAFNENDAATAITSALSLSDVDDTNLESATVQITGNFATGEDVLAFVNQNGISGSFNATNGTLTLIGTATVAQYQTALRSVTYVNTSDNPSAATRTVSYTINDGDANSNVAARNIAFTAVNDSPVTASIEAGALAYTENDTATAITSALSLSDVDDTNLESATVQITGNFATGQDVLAFVNQNGISGSFNATNGTLTLTGTATIAQYQTALRSVTYVNTSNDPSAATRTISYTVNDGDASSNIATRNIAFTAVNDAPVTASIEASALAYSESDPATAITAALSLSDVDDTNLESATVQITGNFATGEDVLAFANQNGISGSFNATNGTLTLTGTATVAQYQTALRSVTYQNTSSDPSAATRTVTYTVNDGAANSNTATRNIAFTAANDAPVTASIEGSALAYTENDTAAAVTSTLAISDVDDTNLESATVQITGNFASGEDVLAFVNQNGISGSFNTTNGTLTLTGTATVAQYQTALRSVTYVNTSDDPSAATRTVSYTVNDGDVNSNIATRNIAFTAVNDAPVTASIEAGSLAYTENDAATAITSALTLSDLDDTNLESATVQITGNFASSEDVLAFVDQNGITGSFNTTNGTLTLTGTATVAQYQTALRSVTYVNTSDDPSAATRTVSYAVNDGDVNSNIAARNIAFTAVNDAPVTASIEAGALAYTENDAATAITATLALSDLDDTNLESATVQITGNFATGEDVLAFVNQNGITGSFNTTNGTLTLTGTATVAQYQTALRSVTYTNTSDDPSAATRTVSYTVNDGDVSSNIATRNIAFTATNDAPVTATIEGTALAYTENDAATAITSALSLSDVDDTNLESATVQITSNFGSGEDVLAFVNQNGITGSFNSTNGTLTLSGSATVAQYQTALRSVTYVNTSDDPSAATRTVSYTVNDGDVNSNIATRNIAFTATNDAPVTATIEGTALAYTENDAATAITATLALSDLDDTNLESATVQITGNFATGEDVLAFVNQNGISGSFNTTNGTLTLTGTATVAQYQTALRSVTYVNTSDDPSAATRTVSFTVNDGDVSSNIATRNIAFTATNDAPVTATIESTALAYTENDAATAITATLALSDLDDTNLESATVQITGNFATGEDVLAFVNQNGISGSFNATNGTLTLTGTATVAQYQTALRSVTYVNTSDDPSAATRTASYTVNDGDANSNIATRNIAFTATNDAPVTASIEGGVLAYTENDAATAITTTLALNDLDDTNLESATVQITGNFATGEDVLAFVNQSGISGSFNTTNGTLTLTGSATVAQYQAALRSVTYQNTSDDPSAATRTVSYTVNDGDVNSNIATRNIAFTATNDAPVTASIEAGALAYTENDAATAITSSLALSDLDDTNLESATVQITGNFSSGEDVLAFTNQNGISGSYNATNGTLTLTGTATVAQYQAALRSVTYQNTSDNPSASTRVVSFAVSDGDVNSNIAARSVTLQPTNDDPSNSGSLPTRITVQEDVLSNVDLSSLTLVDTDAQSGTLTITLSTTGAGDLTAAAYSGISQAGTSTALELTGTVADLNAFFNVPNNVRYLHGTEHSFGNNSDTISVTVNDNGNTGTGGGLDQNFGSVIVDISPINDEQALTTNTGATFSEGATGNTITSAMLETTDVENVASAVQYTLTAVPSHGQLRLNGSTLSNGSTFTQADIASGLLTYDNDGSDFTADGFSFTVDDGAGSATSGAFAITILAVNDAPTVSLANVVLDVDENTDTSSGMKIADIIVGDDNLGTNALSLSGADAGDFEILGTELWLRSGARLDFEFQAAFSITVEVDDAAVGGFPDDQAATVLTVNDINEAPTALGQSYSTPQATPLEVVSGGLLAGSDDVDGDLLTIQLVTGPAHGTLALNADGTFTYTPNDTYSGIETFTVLVTDGLLDSAAVTVTIDIEQGIQPPSGDDAPDAPEEPDVPSEDPPEQDETFDEIIEDEPAAQPPLEGPIGPLSSTTHLPVTIAGLTELERSQDRESTGRQATVREGDRPGPASRRGSTTTSETSRLYRSISTADGLLTTHLLSISPAAAVEYQEQQFQADFAEIAAGTTALVTSGVTVGYVVWIVRGGSLIASTMAAAPAWLSFDPLPIVEASDLADQDDDESLASLVSKDS